MMVLLRFMSVCGLCRQARSVVRIVAPLGWLIALLYALIGALTNREWLTTPQLSLSEGYDGLMSELGFVFDPVLYPHAHHDVDDLPVFVATIDSDELHSFHRFLGSFRIYFRQKKLVVYDFGLTPEELRLVRHTCQCLVRTMHWERYPAHVRDRTLKAYRPILIQETLREFGIIFWCNHKMRFNSSNIDALRARAEAMGLVAWSVHPYPTSTYTHDGMFRYLGASRHSFHFHRMVEPDAALYVNTYRLHHRLLRPWVSCALDPECLAPPGAQVNGCDLTRRPRYRYAGCHRYDSSAFNIILGQMFYYDDTQYIPSRPIFHLETVLPPHSKRMYRLSAEARMKPPRSRTNSYPAAEWEIAENEKTDSERDPILFRRRP